MERRRAVRRFGRGNPQRGNTGPAAEARDPAFAERAAALRDVRGAWFETLIRLHPGRDSVGPPSVNGARLHLRGDPIATILIAKKDHHTSASGTFHWKNRKKDKNRAVGAAETS